MTATAERAGAVRPLSNELLMSINQAYGNMINLPPYPTRPADKPVWELDRKSRESYEAARLNHSIVVLKAKYAELSVCKFYQEDINRIYSTYKSDEAALSHQLEMFLRQTGLPENICISICPSIISILNNDVYGFLQQHLIDLHSTLQAVRKLELSENEAAIKRGSINPDDIDSPLLGTMEDENKDFMIRVAAHSTDALSSRIDKYTPLTSQEYFGFTDALGEVYEILNESLASESEGSDSQRLAIIDNLFSLMAKDWQQVRTDYDDQVIQSEGKDSPFMPYKDLRSKVMASVDRLLHVSWGNYGDVKDIKGNDWRFKTINRILRVDFAMEEALNNLAQMPRKTADEKTRYDEVVNKLRATRIAGLVSSLSYANADFLGQLFDAYAEGTLPLEAKLDVRTLASIVKNMIDNDIMAKPESGMIGSLIDFVGKGLRGKAAKVAA